MDRVVVFLAALVPALLVLEYGVAKARGSWANEALWTAFMVGAVGQLVAVFAELGLTHIPFIESLHGLPHAAVMAVLVAAIPEEGIKFFVLTRVAERHVDARRYQDIVMLALAVGLGFATLENLFYLVSPGDWRSIAAIRALTSVPGHGIDGLIMGSLVTLARLSSGRRTFLLVLSLVVPVLSHAAYDLPLLTIETDHARSAVPWAVSLWFLVLILSAIVALVLSKRALRKAADADRRSDRDSRPLARPLPLVSTGLVLLTVSPCVAIAWAYAANITPAWIGAIICVLPVALGLDLIGSGVSAFRQQRSHAAA